MIRFTFLVICTVLIFADTAHSEGLKLYPTMPKSEVVEIFKCFNKGKEPETCDAHKECLEEYPKKLNSAVKKCLKKLPGESPLECKENKPIFKDIQNFSKLYDCKAAAVLGKLTTKDEKKLKKYEKCVRKLKAKTCPKS